MTGERSKYPIKLEQKDLTLIRSVGETVIANGKNAITGKEREKQQEGRKKKAQFAMKNVSHKRQNRNPLPTN